jgi:hypothetical protein
LGSLVGQDFGKIILLGLVFIGIITVTVFGKDHNLFVQLFTSPDLAWKSIRAMLGKG